MLCLALLCNCTAKESESLPFFPLKPRASYKFEILSNGKFNLTKELSSLSRLLGGSDDVDFRVSGTMTILASSQTSVDLQVSNLSLVVNESSKEISHSLQLLVAELDQAFSIEFDQRSRFGLLRGEKQLGKESKSFLFTLITLMQGGELMPDRIEWSQFGNLRASFAETSDGWQKEMISLNQDDRYLSEPSKQVVRCKANLSVGRDSLSFRLNARIDQANNSARTEIIGTFKEIANGGVYSKPSFAFEYANSEQLSRLEQQIGAASSALSNEPPDHVFESYLTRSKLEGDEWSIEVSRILGSMVLDPELLEKYAFSVLAMKRPANVDAAIAALSKCSLERAEAVLCELVSKTTDKSDVSGALLFALGTREFQSEKSIDTLLKVARKPHNALVVENSWLALGSAISRCSDEGVAAKAIKYILEQVNSTVESSRMLGIRAMGNARSLQFLSPLENALSDDNPLIREQAALALRRISAPGVNQLLIRSLISDRAQQVRLAALYALSFRKMDDFCADSIQLVVLTDSSQNVRRAACNVIAKCDRDSNWKRQKLQNLATISADLSLQHHIEQLLEGVNEQ